MKFIVGKVLLFEVETMSDRTEIKLHKVIINQKHLFLSQKKYVGIKSLENWKHSIAFVFVTGNQVASKSYVKEDPSIKKILSNENLFCDIVFNNENRENTISFVRKEIIQELMIQLKKNSILVETVLIGKMENTIIEERLKAYWEKEMNYDTILRSPEKINTFCSIIYYKLQLPILIASFFLLLGNYFANSHFMEKNEKSNITRINTKKIVKVQQEEKNKMNRLMKVYHEVPSYSLASVADRIASYVPIHLQLNLLSILPQATNTGSSSDKKELKMKNNTVIVKGLSDIPGNITLFTQLLSKDMMFSKVEIISLTKQEDTNLFDFELQLTL